MYDPLEIFRREISEPFDLANLNRNHVPIRVLDSYVLPYDENVRVNHLLIKRNDSRCYMNFGMHLPSYISGNVSYLLRQIFSYCADNGLPYLDRYTYLTLDSREVGVGETQREPGIHLDGLQGDEIPIKLNADFQFIWANTLPTQFYCQKVDASGWDLSRDNIFKKLEEDLKGQKSRRVDRNEVYLMNAYYPHKATINNRWPIKRTFFRLSFTHCPITSTRMTINPLMEYNYPIHTTSGRIPSHLK